MDYNRIYLSFIDDRRSRPAPDGYSEKHHILPRSLGGSDEQSNMIRLTPEDHYFAHLLLAKIHGGKMWNAIYAMCHLSGADTGRDKERIRARANFGHVKRSLAEHFRATSTGRRHAEVAKVKVSISMLGNKHFLGKTHSQETRLRMSESQQGRSFSPETIDKMRISHLGNSATDETKTKMSLRRRLKGPRVGLKGVHKHRNKWTSLMKPAASQSTWGYLKAKSSLRWRTTPPRLRHGELGIVI